MSADAPVASQTKLKHISLEVNALRPRKIKLCIRCYNEYEPLLKLTPGKASKDKCDGCGKKDYITE